MPLRAVSPFSCVPSPLVSRKTVPEIDPVMKLPKLTPVTAWPSATVTVAKPDADVAGVGDPPPPRGAGEAPGGAASPPLASITSHNLPQTSRAEFHHGRPNTAP